MAAVYLFRPAGQCQLRVAARTLGGDLALRDDAEPLGEQPERFVRVAGIEHDEAGTLADLQPEMVQTHDGGIDAGDHVEAMRHVGLAGHLRDVKAH